MELINFSSLPKELRFIIYELVLAQAGPIVVWSAKFKSTCERLVVMPEYKLLWDSSTMSESRQGLQVNILRANKLISTEAACILYGQNSFCFLGDHDWIHAIAWLRTIGIHNSVLISKLVMSVPQPTVSWQTSDGSRVLVRNSKQNELWPRNHEFGKTPSPVKEGLVENINPALEIFIAALLKRERRTAGPYLFLTLDLQFNLLPGVVLFGVRDSWSLHDQFFPICRGIFRARYFSMDMPDLIQHWCESYTEKNGKRIVVRWRVETEPEFINEKKEMLLEKGWDIVSETNCERPYGELYIPRENYEPPVQIVRFVLQRRKIACPLRASNPIPNSGADGPHS